MRLVGKLTGHGDYTYDKPGPWGKVGSEVGELLGGHFGGEPGRMIGKKLGSYAHYIGRIFGSGDYITSNGIIASNNLVMPDQAPTFGSGAGEVNIAHREYLFDVFSSGTSGAFQVLPLSINPGLSATFPWISRVVGATFQQYRINGMVFEFRSTSSELSTATNLGYVVMATDYDSADASFTSKAQMENTQFGVSCKPSKNMLHAIECARSQTAVSELYVRGGTVPAGSDSRLYDLGRFYIATGGVVATNVPLGELWVSYDITLFKPILQVPGYLTPTAIYPITLATAGAQPLLPAGAPVIDSIGLSFPTGGLSFTFPFTIPINSYWRVEWVAATNAGGESLIQVPTSFTGSNGLALFTGYPEASYWFPNPLPPGSNQAVAGTVSVLKYTGGGSPNTPPTVTFAAIVNPFTPFIAVTLTVSQLNGNI